MKKRVLFVLFFIALFVIGVSAFSFNQNLFSKGGELKVTLEHPFLLNGSWVEAKDLKVGDELFTVSGKKARITSIRDVNSSVDVYNLEVEDYSDFVLSDGIVVHNSNKVKESIPEIEERLANGRRTGDEQARIDRANELLEQNSLPKLKDVEQENHVLLAHYSPINTDKVLRAGEAGLSKEQIKLLGDNWIIGDYKPKQGDVVRPKGAGSDFSESVFYLQGDEVVTGIQHPSGEIRTRVQKIQDLEFISSSSENNKLTSDLLQTLLTKDGGNTQLGKIQAEDAMNNINYQTKSDKANLIESIKSHIKTTEFQITNNLGSPADMEYFKSQRRGLEQILDVLEGAYRDGSYPTQTSFGSISSTGTDKWSDVRHAILQNFPEISDSQPYHMYYPYEIINPSGTKRTVFVEHYIDNVDGNIVFKAKGGVLPSMDSSRASLEDLTILLDDFAKTATTATTPLERANALAQWEWVNAVTTPSAFGGGTVLAQRDYKLLEAAGFKITEKGFRRIELEALSTTLGDYVNSRTKELMSRLSITPVKH